MIDKFADQDAAGNVGEEMNANQDGGGGYSHDDEKKQPRHLRDRIPHRPV
jgi:hypothetical protein